MVLGSGENLSGRDGIFHLVNNQRGHFTICRVFPLEI
jgi:hypothetical protein